MSLSRHFIVFGLMAVSHSFTAFAQSPVQVCKDNKIRCITTLGSAQAAVGSGIYAVKKYSAAKIFESDNTKTIFDNSTKPEVVSQARLGNQIAQVQEGDKITINYQLSEVENRQHHINLMESNASSSDSSASYHETQALTATRSVYRTEYTTTTNADGTTSTSSEQVYVGEEPDWSARASHAAQASSDRAQARQYRQQAMDARNGGPVPTYDFDQVIDKKDGNSHAVAEFIKERELKQSKIVSMARLSAASYSSLKKMIWTARGATGLAAVAGAVAAEEFVEGAVAQKIEKVKAAQKTQILNRDGSTQGAQ